MRRALILMAIALPALSACGWNDSDSKVTETRMDDIDNIEGTISDEMIPADAVSEMAPVEASAAPAAEKAKTENKPAPAETPAVAPASAADATE